MWYLPARCCIFINQKLLRTHSYDMLKKGSQTHILMQLLIIRICFSALILQKVLKLFSFVVVFWGFFACMHAD